jgi:hypothetical protein
MQPLTQGLVSTEMVSVHRTSRGLLMVVALLATMYGLLHTHGINAPFADTGAPSCAICVNAQSTLTPSPAPIAPPAPHEHTEQPFRPLFADRIAVESLTSRGPPQA